jgi:hypothetical protein
VGDGCREHVAQSYPTARSTAQPPARMGKSHGARGSYSSHATNGRRGKPSGTSRLGRLHLGKCHCSVDFGYFRPSSLAFFPVTTFIFGVFRVSRSRLPSSSRPAHNGWQGRHLRPLLVSLPSRGRPYVTHSAPCRAPNAAPATKVATGTRSVLVQSIERPRDPSLLGARR